MKSCTEKSYTALRTEHLVEYQNYYDRVRLFLGEEDDERDLRQRLLDFKDHPEDIALSALLFQYGRYLLISSSRPGTQPANLQGIWNAELVPPWVAFKIEVTPVVFCAVRAVMALMAYTPFAIIVLISAWMPAPPLESLPAIVTAVLILVSPFQ